MHFAEPNRMRPALLLASLSLILAASACAPRPLAEVAPTVAPAGATPTPSATSTASTIRRRAVSAVSGAATVVARASETLHITVRVAPAEKPAAPAPSLAGLIDGVLADPDTTDYGIVVEDLSSGSRVAINDAQVFPSASLYKLGVAWLVMRQVDAGLLSLDDQLTIQDEDTVEPEPDGGFGAGDTPALRDALGAMISVSSNAAAHAFLRLLGRDAFDQEMDRIGLTQTRVPDDSLAVTSAGDIAHLLRLVATSPELSDSSRDLLEQYMTNIAPPDAVRDALPDSVGIIDKTGNLADASNVGALLQSPRGTVILVVVDTGVNPGDARGVIAQTALAAYSALLQ